MASLFYKVPLKHLPNLFLKNPSLTISSKCLALNDDKEKRNQRLQSLNCSLRPYNVQIEPEDDELEEKLILRFRRSVFKAEIVQECRRRRYFENAREKKKRKSRWSRKRPSKRRPAMPVEEMKLEEDYGNWEDLDFEGN